MVTLKVLIVPDVALKPAFEFADGYSPSFSTF
jgi:hypothetical protein